MRKKVKCLIKVRAEAVLCSFSRWIDARSKKGRAIRASIKEALLENGLQYFGQPILFVPRAQLDRVRGETLELEIELPAPEWAKLKAQLDSLFKE